MCDIPIEIDDAEKLVRAIFYPPHVDTQKNRFKPAAVRAPPETDEILVGG